MGAVWQRVKSAGKHCAEDPSYLTWQLRGKLLYKAMEPYSYAAQGKGSPRMTVVTFFLTWDCNLRCVMCNLWGEAGSCFIPDNHSPETLPPETWIRAVHELSPYRPEILLTGGEPLLYRGYAEIAKAAKKSGLRVSLISNGTLLEKEIETLLSYVDRINISIDGKGELHDTIRKKRGHYEKLRQGIETLDREKRKRKSKTPYLVIACTMQERNQNALLPLAEDLAHWDAEIQSLVFQHQEFVGEEGLAQTEAVYASLGSSMKIWRGFSKVPVMDISLLLKQKRTLEKKSWPFSLFFFPSMSEAEISRFYQQPSSFVKEKNRRCIGPWVEALITPEGNFWICPDYPTGNIRDQAIPLLWNNAQARSFRNRLQKNGPLAPVCRACQCFYNR